ncbi:hypothetical protein CF336_g4422 [Tilletia laevis]|nr:hypothetical protein CF336_g4422 [Tilletia laevis]
MSQKWVPRSASGGALRRRSAESAKPQLRVNSGDNLSYLRHAPRELAPLKCMDHIYRHQMEKYFSRSIEAINCGSPIVPIQYKRLQAIIQDARRMSAVSSDNTSGCVTSASSTQYVVKLPASPTDVGSCDCG